MKLFYEKINKKLTARQWSSAAQQSFMLKDYLHWHKNMEICQMLKGRCDFLIGEKTYTGCPGDMIVINSGEIHKFDPHYGDCDMRLTTFDPMLLYSLQAELGVLLPHITLAEQQAVGLDRRLDACFSELCQERSDPGKASELLCHAKIIEIYALLLKHFRRTTDAPKTDPSRLISFQEILEYISEHYAEGLTLESIAQHFGYSAGYVSGMFRTRTGVNFKYYLDNIRVSKATDLLLSTDMTVTEIAFATGHESVRTFNNVFKRISGTVPTELRAAKRK